MDNNVINDAQFLDINNLFVEYKTDLETVYAVNGVSLSLKRGETLGLVGETGAGKTTLALAIMRLLPERTGRIPVGSIEFEGQDVLAMDSKALQNMRGKHIAMIFQDPMTSLNPVITIGDQIGEAILLHTDDPSKEAVERRVDEVLSMVGIPVDRKTDYPHQFSGGMKQRVVIAMALACEPDLIIADEPTTALDVTIQAQVLLMMRDLRDRLNTAMIMITHDFGIVAQTCDNVAVMYAGHIIEIGTADDIFNGKKHHPYTEGLFRSIPRLSIHSRRLDPIPGLMPDPSIKQKGCAFYDRCSHRMDICAEAVPELRYFNTQGIACNLYNSER